MRSRTAQLAVSCTRRQQTSTCRHNSQPRRAVHISAAPSSVSPGQDFASVSSSSNSTLVQDGERPPDAQFETLGVNSSLLSVHTSASQPLYTRRGTLVGFGGDPIDAISTLSPLEPIRRLPFAVPWLYQKVINTRPSSLLIAAKSPHAAFAVLDLDGRVDWRVVKRDGLLAWTGHELQVKPGVEPRFGLAHFGTSTLTGRGLVALVGAGQIYRVRLDPGESYVAHPSSVVAYSMGRNEPQPFRFKSTSLKLQVPDLGRFLPHIQFFRDMRETQFYRWTASALYTLRTWARRTIWGDRLFIRFHGPTTVLLQSRGSRLRDMLTEKDVNEIADSPAGSLQAAISPNKRPIPEWQLGQKTQPETTTLRYASVDQQQGSVTFDAAAAAADAKKQ